MKEKIKAFAELLEREQIEQRHKDNLACEANLMNCKVTIKEGNKYVKVDIGSSGRYMIDKEGNIYGIKAYGVIHLGHHYGTLETISSYFWGGYTAAKVSDCIPF